MIDWITEMNMDVKTEPLVVDLKACSDPDNYYIYTHVYI